MGWQLFWKENTSICSRIWVAKPKRYITTQFTQEQPIRIQLRKANQQLKQTVMPTKQIFLWAMQIRIAIWASPIQLLKKVAQTHKQDILKKNVKSWVTRSRATSSNSLTSKIKNPIVNRWARRLLCGIHKRVTQLIFSKKERTIGSWKLSFNLPIYRWRQGMMFWGPWCQEVTLTFLIR